MKMLRLYVGLSLAACVASARAELSPVSFTVGKQQFKPGDAIVIDQVLAGGTKVVVRGHHRLASAAKCPERILLLRSWRSLWLN